MTGPGSKSAVPARGFTLVELVVVLGIIMIFLAFLTPMMAMSRLQAAYARWQAFNREQSIDPDVIAHWDFQLESNPALLVNLAAGDTVETPFATPRDLNGTFPSLPSRVQGRYRGQSAIDFRTTPSAIRFGSHVKRALSSLDREISISFWARTYGSAASTLINATTGADTASGRVLNIQCLGPDAKVSFDCGNDGKDYTTRRLTASSSQYSPYYRQWNHWAMVGDHQAGIASIYLNGTLVATGVLPAGGSFHGIKTLALGSAPDNTDHFNGAVDDVIIYKRALSAAEVRQIYTMGIP